MIIRLRTKMAITHGTVAIITIFFVIIASFLLINDKFRDYLSENRLSELNELVKGIEETRKDDNWQEAKLTKLGLEALKKGYFIAVKDNFGEVVWQPQKIEQNTYNKEIKKIEEKITGHFGTLPSTQQTTKYLLRNSSEQYGVVEISYYTNYFLTEHDLMFLNYLNTSLLWVAGASFLTAIILSYIISSKISLQLDKIITTTKALSKRGKIDKEKISESNIVEIKELVEAIKDLEINLHEKEVSQKRLTADIAHELRTPLSTLQSHLEALIEGIWQPTEDRLKSCHEEILRMASLVKDLEQLNRYETSQIKLIKSSFNIGELVKNIYTNYQSDFIKKNIEFKFSGEDTEVIADKDKIGQVIVNLVSNSLKYTPEGGRVFINCTRDARFLCIVINDNGIGISPQDLPNVFNRLYRVDSSRTRTTGGAGIGLAVAKAIVEAHDGHIGVVSQVGLGTEFTVIIPIS